jgi:hypothetical protein
MTLYKGLVLAPKGDYAMNIRWILLIPLLSLTLGSCGGSPQMAVEKSPDLPSSSPTREPLSTLVPTQSNQGDNMQMNSSLPTPSASGLEGLIEKAKEDLAQRLSISLDQISLGEATGVIWPDSSVGCPQPGMKYLQVPEDGARIVLEVEGISYEYHMGGRRGLFLCEKNFKNPSPLPQIDITNLTPPVPENSIPPGEDK